MESRVLKDSGRKIAKSSFTLAVKILTRVERPDFVSTARLPGGAERDEGREVQREGAHAEIDSRITFSWHPLTVNSGKLP